MEDQNTGTSKFSNYQLSTSMPYDVVANIKPIADDNNYEEEEEGDNMSAALWKTGIQEPVSPNYQLKYIYAL